MAANNDLRKLISEALQSEEWVTTYDLREYVKRFSKFSPNERAISQTLRYMCDEGLVLEKDDRYALTTPQSSPLVPSNREDEINPLPPYQQKRSGRFITIEHSPLEVTDVGQQQIRRMNVWMTVPLFGNIRLCIGPSIPRWSPEQETYDDVSCIKITTKDGKATEMNLDSKNPLTIAPGGST